MAHPLLHHLHMRSGVVLAIVLALTAPALADDTDSTETESYAVQVLAADAAAIAVTVAGNQALDSNAMTATGIGLGVVAGPTVHLANGNYAGAAKSFALRVTLPFAAAWLSEKLAPKPLCFCEEDDVPRIRGSHVLGLAVGLAAASVIDASTMAKKPVKRTGREWRPDLTFKQGGVRVTVATKF